MLRIQREFARIYRKVKYLEFPLDLIETFLFNVALPERAVLVHLN